MRNSLKLLALSFAVLAMPVAAETQSYYYYYYAPTKAQPATTRYAAPQTRAERPAIAAYGPFRVLDERTASLVGVTDSRSPALFEAMLRDHPRIATLRFVECPGTYDDLANLALGRMIRAAGIAAEVPAGGSVRSGAVELVLAGTALKIDDRAEFAVHAWLDEDGHGANDYAPGSPEHSKYLAYYREMGMAADQAASFYAMTNSTPFERAHWLTGAEMRRWVGRDTPARVAEAPASAPVVLAAVATPTPVTAYAPATMFLSPVPVPMPALAAAPRIAYLDLELSLY